MMHDISFEQIVALLQRHLPRPVPDGPISVTAHSLSVTKGGVSLQDIAQFLGDLGGGDDFLPEGLGLDAVRLSALELERTEATGHVTLDFTLMWTPEKIELFEPVAFDLAEIDVSWETGGRLRAVTKVQIDVDGHDVELSLSLPEQMVRATLLPPRAGDDATLAHDRALELLGKSGISGGGISVSALSLSASIPFRHVALHVELKDLFSLGPVHLKWAKGDVTLSEQDSSIGLAALVLIDVAGHAPIEIQAEAEVDRHGWRVAGSLDLPAHLATVQELVVAAGGARTDLPSAIADLALRHVAAEIDTHANRFRLDVGVEWEDGADMQVHLEKTGDGLNLSGTLHLHGLAFKLEFDKGTDTFIAASFEAEGGRTLGLEDLLRAANIGDDGALGPSGFHLDIDALGAVIGPNKEALIAASMQAGIDLRKLGELPVLGALLPKGANLGLSLYPSFLSSAFDQADIDHAKTLLPDGVNLPATVAPGMQISAQLHLGQEQVMLGESTPNAAQAAPTTPAQTPTAQPAAETGLTWVDVDQSLGPLHVSRAGYALDKTTQAVDLALDSEITVGGLKLSLEGLGARFSLKDHSLTPHLSGAGLHIKRGQLEVGAEFLNNDGDFEGAVDIGLKDFGLHAIGAFTMIEDTPSIFAFGTLDMPLGGPVFFFVEGLAAGLGVHRSLHMPEIKDIHSFPMISAASGAGDTTDVGAQLRALHKYVAPKLGDYFVAAGIKFNSFRLLHGQAVLMVQFGHKLEFDVVGTASYAMPPDLPAHVPALARIDLDLLARFDPAKGELAVDARLDPRSYVYSPLCHLSGGFALYAWMAGEHAGDFVLSVGGYFPDFEIPAHYPRVPRITLKFQVTPDVYLKGTAYFAMIPSGVMAGGALHAQVNMGSLHAWADFSADFEMGWEPFFYHAKIHIGIGARWKCFHTHASADLNVWGPDFSGTASVDWSVFSFEIEFGPQSSPYKPPITFERFKHAFLGIGQEKNSANEKLGITVSAGAAGEIDDIQIVDPVGLIFNVSTPIPMTDATVAGAAADGVSKQIFGMPPLGGARLGASGVVVTVRHGNTDISAQFAAEAVTTKVPAALWHPSAKVKRDAAPMTATTGLTIHHTSLATPKGSATRKVGLFQYPTPAVSRDLALWGRADTAFAQGPDAPPFDDLAALGLAEDLFWPAPTETGA